MFYFVTRLQVFLFFNSLGNLTGMRGSFAFTMVLLGCIQALQAQQLKRIEMKDPVICYARFDNCASHVDPPQEYLNRKNAKIKTANIEVNYSGGFPADAKVAFDYAVGIWESLISSPVPIKIQANWAGLGPGVLGSAIYWSAFANFNGAQKLNVYYPVALAEKIAGEELNDPAEFEILANFNSGINWYFGTTGTPATGQYDFATIVLHEIGHGLGFSSSFDVTSSTGQVGAFGTEIPIIFDTSIKNGSGANLIQNFSTPSAALKTQLTSNNLKIDVIKTPALTAKLYAPTSYDGGSSISHLDEDTYGAGNLDALMTPQIGPQEVNHNPGSRAFGILSDLGWEMVKVEHQPLPNTEDEVSPLTVSATLINDENVQYDASKVKLNYTSDGENFTTVSMTGGVNDEFTATIPAPPSFPWTYGYYISVGDNVGRTVLAPGKIVRVGQSELQNLFAFEIGPDTQSPKVVHSQQPYLEETSTELIISATISDNIGIDSAFVEYQLNDGATQKIKLNLIAPEEDSIYTATLNLGALTDGDQVHYTITAVDNSLTPKTTVSPLSGTYSVGVFGFAEPVDTYSNDFSIIGTDFFGNGFSITTPAGFSNPAIHTTHPYPEGDAFPDNEFEFVYLLKIPITIAAENTWMRFDEVVLVEPGELGSVFGDDDFYDYVVVEGSKDFGVTWIPVANGYDSRARTEWISHYNSSTSGNNSTATGNSTLFRSRGIDLTNAFTSGDVIIIRFRLYSDQLAAGWGWAIDNLYIQDPITSAETDLEVSLSVYPNPAKENIVVEANGLSSSYFQVQLMNAQGQSLYANPVETTNGKLSHTIPITTFPAGVYFVKVMHEGIVVIKKIIKIN